MPKKFIAKKIIKAGKSGKRTVTRTAMRIEAGTRAKRSKVGAIIIPPGSFLRKHKDPAWAVKQMKEMNKYHGGRTKKLPKGGKKVLGYGAKDKVVYGAHGSPVHKSVAKRMRNIELHKKSWGNPLTANPKMGKRWKKAIDDTEKYTTWRKWKSVKGATYVTGAVATGAGGAHIAVGVRQKMTGKRHKVGSTPLRRRINRIKSVGRK